MNTPENNLITVFTHKEIVLLYKTFLETIEDLRQEHDSMLQKLKSSGDPKVVEMTDYFTPEKYDRIRKRVLDQGNECSRRIVNFLDFFEFIIDKGKVEDAAKQRKTITTKKVIISSPTIVE